MNAASLVVWIMTLGLLGCLALLAFLLWRIAGAVVG